MSITYFAINHHNKEYFYEPSWHRSACPEKLFHPNNPFCGMYAFITNMDIQGEAQWTTSEDWKVETCYWMITSDCECDSLEGYTNITERLYKDFCESTGYRDDKGSYREEEFPQVREVIITKTNLTIYIELENDDEHRIDVLLEHGKLIKDSLSIRDRWEHNG